MNVALTSLIQCNNQQIYQLAKTSAMGNDRSLDKLNAAQQPTDLSTRENVRNTRQKRTVAKIQCRTAINESLYSRKCPQQATIGPSTKYLLTVHNGVPTVIYGAHNNMLFGFCALPHLTSSEVFLEKTLIVTTPTFCPRTFVTSDLTPSYWWLFPKHVKKCENDRSISFLANSFFSPTHECYCILRLL